MLTIHKPVCTKEETNSNQFPSAETLNIPFIQPFQNNVQSTEKDLPTQDEQTLQPLFSTHATNPTLTNLNLYETDLSKYDTGQCTGRDLHDLDSTYDMSTEVKDIILPFCASTEALSLGLHYEDESILLNNNYDPSLWHRQDSGYRTSHFQESYRTSGANNNNVVSHYSKCKDSSGKSGSLISKQCDGQDGLLPQ